jgi:ABC-type glycerol-3-phosphate transport system substrate-binding protein
MSYANGTQFYNLPQTVGTDKRDWFDTNAAFAAIDAALHAAATGQAADAEAIAAINMMVELFSLYSLPLTAQSFYDSFRNTTLPMGQAGFDTYLQLLTAAPEITGKWDIALPLGTKQADGTIDRTNCVTVKAVCIFEQSEKHSEAWDFIKWWLSEETQVRFANGIVATYGETFMWNTANVEAFKSLPLEYKT